MGKAIKSWIVPTDAIRLKAVRLSRKYLREGYSSTKARNMAAKTFGYSVASIYQWEKQFPLKHKVKVNPVKRTTTTVHSNKQPISKTTTTAKVYVNGTTVDRNINSASEDELRILSVDLMTHDGNIVTLTERSLKNIVKLFG